MVRAFDAATQVLDGQGHTAGKPQGRGNVQRAVFPPVLLYCCSVSQGFSKVGFSAEQVE